MIASDNMSHYKAMMRFIGLECGAYRKPNEPLTQEEYLAFAKKFAALGIVRENQAKEQLGL